MGAFSVGIFDDAEKLAGQDTGGTEGTGGTENSAVSDLTQDGEKLLDNETGDKFDSEIQSAGTTLDQQADQNLPKL